MLKSWPTLESNIQEITIQKPTPFQMNHHMNRLVQDGYTICHQILPNHIFPEFNQALDTYKSHTIAPVGIVTHPLYWQLLQALTPIIDHFLRGTFYILPETWAWDISPGTQHKGWAPHREKLFSTVNEKGEPMSVSVWIPITDATPENSCLYVLPAGEDEHYPCGPTKYEYPIQSIRAIPAKPGDIIIFNHNVLHWGSQSSQWANIPRRALAFEAQKSNLKPYNTPVYCTPEMPPLDECVRLYEQLIKQYHHIQY